MLPASACRAHQLASPLTPSGYHVEVKESRQGTVQRRALLQGLQPEVEGEHEDEDGDGFVVVGAGDGSGDVARSDADEEGRPETDSLSAFAFSVPAELSSEKVRGTVGGSGQTIRVEGSCETAVG